MSEKIIFVRHGESQGNKMKIYQGVHNLYGLTPLGKLQSKKAASLISDLKLYPEKLFYSPLIRSKETAIILKNNLLSIKEVEENELLKEIDMGLLNGMSKNLAKSLYNKKLLEIKNGLCNYDFFNGESKDCINSRVCEIKSVLESCKYNNVIVVSHGGIIRLIIESFLKVKVDDIEYENGSIIILNKKKDKYSFGGYYQ